MTRWWLVVLALVAVGAVVYVSSRGHVGFSERASQRSTRENAAGTSSAKAAPELIRGTENPLPTEEEFPPFRSEESAAPPIQIRVEHGDRSWDPREATVLVHVVDQDGLPYAGIDVCLGPWNGTASPEDEHRTTDAAGEAEFRGVSVERGVLSLAAQDLLATSSIYWRRGFTNRVEVVLTRATSVVKGRLRPRLPGPVDRREVVLSRRCDGTRLEYRVLCDDQGLYHLEGVIEGTYKCEVSPFSNPSRAIEFELPVPKGQQFEHDIPFGYRSIFGVIVEADTGKRAVRAMVSAEPRSGWVRTQQGPEYEFLDLPPGEYRLSVMAPGYGTHIVESIHVVGGEELRMDVRLEPEARLLLEVRGPAGEPVTTGLYINLWETDSVGRSCPYGPSPSAPGSGVLAVASVPPGEYRLDVLYWRNPQARAVQDISLREGENRLTVQLEPVRGE